MMLPPGYERTKVPRKRIWLVVLAFVAVFMIVATAAVVGVQDQQPEQVDVDQLQRDLERLSDQ